MKDDRVYLIYIVECIDNIKELTEAGREAFFAAKHDQAAVIYYLQTLAESTQRLSSSLKDKHPEIEWTLISGLRNRLVHEYLDINRNIVWSIVTNQLDPLRATISQMLEELGPEG